MALTNDEVLTMLNDLEHSIRNGNRTESVSIASMLLRQIEESIRHLCGPLTGERNKQLVIAMHVAGVRRECMNRDLGSAMKALTIARKFIEGKPKEG